MDKCVRWEMGGGYILGGVELLVYNFFFFSESTISSPLFKEWGHHIILPPPPDSTPCLGAPRGHSACYSDTSRGST